MKIVKAAQLAKTLGISRFTIRDLCRRDTALAFKKGRDYYIRLDVLATRPGFDAVSVLLLTKKRWIKAVDLAHMAQCPRRTVAYWCKRRPHLAHRIGRIWYVCIDDLGATPDQMETLMKWAPDKKTTIKFLDVVSDVGKLRAQLNEESCDG